MYFILTLIIISLILWLSQHLTDKYNYGHYYSDIIMIFKWVFIVITIISICLIPIIHNYSSSRIVEYQSRKETIINQRDTYKSDYENFQIYKEIVDDNAWLSTTKYYANNKWFSVYFNKEVNELTPID